MMNRLASRELLGDYAGKSWWRKMTLLFGKSPSIILIVKLIASLTETHLFAWLRILTKPGLLLFNATYFLNILLHESLISFNSF